MDSSQLKIYYAHHVEFSLPDGHRFPIDKYRQLEKKLIDDQILSLDYLHKSPLATLEELETTHCPDYIRSFLENKLSKKNQKQIGFPWSEGLALRVRASTGGTIAAARQALLTGYSAQLAGGTHHAHYDWGSGFCVFNDFAVTANVLLGEKKVERILILDLDVHQGDGNATLLANRDEVLVANMHCYQNFPLKKTVSDIDIELSPGCTDLEYLQKLDELLQSVQRFESDLILYQAGVDPLKSDKLGKTSLSLEGLKERDRLVFEFAISNKIPIAHALGGGYADPIEESIEAYANTFRVASEKFSRLFSK